MKLSIRLGILSFYAFGFSVLPLQAAPEEKGDQLVVVTPAAVKATITREAAGGAILALERGDESPTVYRATVKLDGREYVITVDAAGKLEQIELRNHEEQAEPNLENFPAPAKAALKKLARGANVEQVDVEKTQVSYSIIVTQEGAKYRIVVDEQGKLLGKQRLDE